MFFDDDFDEDLIDSDISDEGDSLFFSDKDDKKDDTDYLKSFWGLNDNEVKEVKNGGYDPWNFEEEDLEEDDYYYEDED